MKLKRITIFLITLVLGMTLASCNRGSNGKTVIKVGFWPEKTETYDVAMYNTWKENFEKDHPEYEIVGDPYTYSPDTIGSKYMMGSLPTIFQTWFTEPEKLVSKKFIRSIDKELKELGWDKMMDENMKEALTFNNEIYGVPRDGYGLGLLINIKTLGDNGLLPEDKDGNYVIYNEDGTPAYPTTFEEIYQTALAIQEYDETKGILICSTNKNGGWQFSNIAWNFGAELQYQDASGKWISNLVSDEAVAALSWIQKMKKEDLLLNSISVSYDDWYNAIESKVAMAIVGSDQLHLAQVNGNISMDDLAYVPMPTGDGKHNYSLYGGVPYVFNSSATDEQVKGALLFLEYIGRSPIVSDISKAAMELGNETSKNKNQPILPKIKPWTNNDYVEYASKLENDYVTVKMENYEEFFNKISENKHKEVEKGAQEMYEYLDIAIQSVLQDPYVANPKTLLETANSKMQSYLDTNVNK
ncbi:MAG: hypothetical protein NC087_04860 [Anaeroplasma bactoclasticum]|nr:hypothetical protein [Anaeroplasma bactoclasticum]